jgi:hypothetical protein
LKLSDNKFFENQAINNSYENSDKLLLLLLFPLFKIKNAFEYAQSPLYKILSCGKDVFYRLLNNEILDWRSLHYSVTKKLIKEVDAQK